jgi:alpha-glucosidase
MGKWAAIARRKGTNWYIGVLNNWEARDITINISRLKTGGKTATVFEDGINADKDATDYRCRQLNIDKDLLSLHLAPGGGYTARIK